MPDDLKVLIGAELDPTSINKISSELRNLGKTQKITVGVNVGNANKSIKSIETKIENLRKIASKPLDLTVSSGNISGALASINSAINKSIETINQLNNSLANVGNQGGSGGIGDITIQLNELSAVIKELSDKDFKIGNIFNYNGQSAAKNGISIYRDQAKELVEYLNQLQNTVANIDSKSMGKIYTQVKDSFVAIDEMNLKDLSKRTGNSSVSGLQSVIDEMQRYKSAMEQIITVAQKYNAKVSMPDMSAYNKAAERVKEFEDKLNKQEDAFIRAATGQTTSGTDSVTSQAELNIESVKNSFQELNGLFEQLQTKINETFDFSNAVSGVGELKEALEGLVNTFAELNKNSTTIIGQAKQALSSANTKTSGVGSTAQISTSSNIPIDSKYYDEITKAANRYNAAFNDDKSTVKSISVYSNELTGAANATVTFANETGRTTQAVFELKEVLNEAGESTGKMDWVNVSTRMKESFTDSGKEIEGTLDFVEKKLSELYTQENRAFNKNNPLTGDFATPIREQIDSLRDELNAIKNDATTAVSAEAKRSFTSRINTLKTDIGVQQENQYANTKLKRVDTSESVKRYTSDINTLENRLKNSGALTEELAKKINEVREGFASVGKEDGGKLGEWQDKYGTLVKEIKEFESSAAGMGQKLASGIETGQLQQIEDTINRLNNVGEQYSGTGVEALKQNLQGLATEYQNVMTQLQSADLTQDQFDALSKKVQELGNQLKQAADKAKIFEGGVKNDEALRKYEQNADTVRMKFEQLQKQYESLSKTNPQIAQRFQDVQNNINNMDPTNISETSREVNNLARECQSASGQSAGLRGALQDAFGGLGSYIARFASSYFIITKAIQGIKSMVDAVKEVDSSLVELQKVTSLTGSSLEQFTQTAYKVGASLGRTGKDVIDAAATFSRAGYDLQEATELAQSALVMTNVGVDIPNTEAAASDMISILKAFDKQAEESMDVIDKLYNVANKEPLDFGNITQMLVTAGGTLAQTGTSLEETIGLLTGAYATLRDTSVSNG